MFSKLPRYYGMIAFSTLLKLIVLSIVTAGEVGYVEYSCVSRNRE